MIKDLLTFCWAGFIWFLGWFFGGLNGALALLITLSVIDYLSGLCVGWLQGNLSSAQGFKGIARKCFIFALVGIANLIDKYSGSQNVSAKVVVCLFYVSNEGISILENAIKLGVPVPDILARHFDVLKNSSKQGVHSHE